MTDTGCVKCGNNSDGGRWCIACHDASYRERIRVDRSHGWFGFLWRFWG